MAELYEFDDYFDSKRQSLCWYSDGDYVRFEHNKQQDLRALRRVRNNPNLINPMKHCERGLESRMTKTALHQLVRRRHALTCAVLQEQYAQICSGIYDEDKLAAVSAKASFGPAMEALERGISYGIQNMERTQESPSAKRHKRSFSLDLEYESDTSSTVACSDEGSTFDAVRTDFKDSIRGSPQPKIPSWKQFLSDIFQSAPIEASVKPNDLQLYSPKLSKSSSRQEAQ